MNEIITKTFIVSGMKCGGCEKNVTIALEALKGIENVKADHTDNTVKVDFNGSFTNINEISSAIEKTGYHVESFSD